MPVLILELPIVCFLQRPGLAFVGFESELRGILALLDMVRKAAFGGSTGCLERIGTTYFTTLA
jgi:hypothetical protein